MSLAPGVRLGSYEVIARLGAGGMGEVYRARDTRLGRDVALKVLPPAFAADRDRMARFEREARLLAALNHPGIAALHGLEERDGTRALVMELVDGPTLLERIERGALPLDEALAVARQIAEALEYAHERGIVHRDLKPANVKLAPDGAVKVLDFGLAKALGDDPASADSGDSPTLSAVATRAGVILGTAAYMSPEQAKGRPADRRSDVWAFGVVLYEMLSGQRLFSGETAAETLAQVIALEPVLASLPASLPHRVRNLLERCLTKDPKQRLQAIGEARIAIEQAIAQPEASAAGERRVRSQPTWRLAAPWALAVGLAAALAFIVPSWRSRRTPPSLEKALRLSVELGADVWLDATGGPQAAAAVLSPDGSVLAFVARKATGEEAQLYLRRLDQPQAAPLPATEGARNPFFSPDGQWVGFFAGGKLKKIAASGGAAVTLCDAPDDRGGSWGEDGAIVFTPTTASGLWRVSSGGGTPEALTTPGPAGMDNSHRWPQVLPEGAAVLFTSGRLGLDETRNVWVQPLPRGDVKVLVKGGYYGRYLASGHVLYMYEGTLFAVPFDLERLRQAGPAVPVLEGVANNVGSSAAQLAFSNRGTLVFSMGEGVTTNQPIQWLDRDGNMRSLRAAPSGYANIRFSPDGGRLSMDIQEAGQRDVWVYEWARHTMSRLTFDPHSDTFPVWTPDGQRLAFASARGGTLNVFWQRADGTGEAQRLTESANLQVPTSWHPNGRLLALHELNPARNDWDIKVLPMEGDEASSWKPGKPTPFLSSPFTERDSAFSPDGRWLAYASNESGRFEVYVRPFPGPGGKWQVSDDGGMHPTWSRGGRELLYWDQERLLTAAYAVEGDSLRFERPRSWSPARIPLRAVNRTFDLHPDGQRVAAVRAAGEEREFKRDHVTLILDFGDELRRIAPAGR